MRPNINQAITDQKSTVNDIPELLRPLPVEKEVGSESIPQPIAIPKTVKLDPSKVKKVGIISLSQLNMGAKVVGTIPKSKIDKPGDIVPLTKGNETAFASQFASIKQDPTIEHHILDNLNDDEDDLLASKLQSGAWTPAEHDYAQKVMKGEDPSQSGFFKTTAYWLDQNNKGLPVPVEKQLPPKNVTIESVWGNKPTKGSFLGNLTKGVVNAIGEAVPMLTALPAMAESAITGEETGPLNTFHQGMKRASEHLALPKHQIEEFSKTINDGTWNNPENLGDAIGSIGGIIAQFAMGGRAIGALGKVAEGYKGITKAEELTNLASKVTKTVAGTTEHAAAVRAITSANKIAAGKNIMGMSALMAGGAYEGARNAGYDPRTSVGIALIQSTVSAIIFDKFGGVLGKAFKGFQESGLDKQVGASIVSTLKKFDLSKGLTPEITEAIYKDALAKTSEVTTGYFKALPKNILKNVATMEANTVAETGLHVLADKMSGKEGDEGYGNPEWSNKFIDAAQQGILFGAFPHLGPKEKSTTRIDKQDLTILDHVKTGNEVDLKVQLYNMYKDGKISYDDFANSHAIIDGYKKLHTQINDIPLTDKAKVDIMNRTMQSEALSTQINTINADESLSEPIKKGKIKILETQKKAFDDQIAETMTAGDSVKPKEEKKVEEPKVEKKPMHPEEERVTTAEDAFAKRIKAVAEGEATTEMAPTTPVTELPKLIPTSKKEVEIHHGEDEYDKAKQVGGQSDTKLEPSVAKEANLAAIEMGKQGVTDVHVSSIKRAVDTAKKLGDRFNYKENKAFDAWNIGDEKTGFEGMDRKDFTPIEEYFQDHPNETTLPADQFPGMEDKKLNESWAQLVTRLANERNRLVSDPNAPDVIGILTHSKNMKILDAMRKHGGEWNEAAKQEYRKDKVESAEVRVHEGKPQPTEEVAGTKEQLILKTDEKESKRETETKEIVQKGAEAPAVTPTERPKRTLQQVLHDLDIARREAPEAVPALMEERDAMYAMAKIERIQPTKTVKIEEAPTPIEAMEKATEGPSVFEPSKPVAEKKEDLEKIQKQKEQLIKKYNAETSKAIQKSLQSAIDKLIQAEKNIKGLTGSGAGYFIIPVKVAKNVLKVMRVAMKGLEPIEENIRKALDIALQYLRNTDWYKNLTDKTKKQAEKELNDVIKKQFTQAIKEALVGEATEDEIQFIADTLQLSPEEIEGMNTGKQFDVDAFDVVNKRVNKTLSPLVDANLKTKDGKEITRDYLNKELSKYAKTYQVITGEMDKEVLDEENKKAIREFYKTHPEGSIGTYIGNLPETLLLRLHNHFDSMHEVPAVAIIKSDKKNTGFEPVISNRVTSKQLKEETLQKVTDTLGEDIVKKATKGQLTEVDNKTAQKYADMVSTLKGVSMNFMRWFNDQPGTVADKRHLLKEYLPKYYDRIHEEMSKFFGVPKEMLDVLIKKPIKGTSKTVLDKTISDIGERIKKVGKNYGIERADYTGSDGNFMYDSGGLNYIMNYGKLSATEAINRLLQEKQKTDKGAMAWSQLQTMINNKPKTEIPELTQSYYNVNNKLANSGKYQSPLIARMLEIGKPEIQESYKDNDFVQDHKGKPIRFMTTEGAKNQETDRVNDAKNITTEDFFVSNLVNFLQGSREDMAGPGRYMQNVEQFSDSHQKYTVDVRRYKVDEIKEEVLKTYAENNPTKIVKGDVEKAFNDDILNPFISRIQKALLIGAIGTRTGEGKFELEGKLLPSALARDFAYNQYYNKICTDAYFKGNSVKDIDYVKLQKRKNTGNGIIIKTLGEVNHAIISDPMLESKIKGMLGKEGEMMDGVQFVSEKFNDRVNDLSGGQFHTIVKTLYDKINEDKSRLHLKGNATVLDGKFVEGYPESKKLHEWMEKNGIDMLSFGSAAKITPKGTVLEDLFIPGTDTFDNLPDVKDTPYLQKLDVNSLVFQQEPPSNPDISPKPVLKQGNYATKNFGNGAQRQELFNRLYLERKQSIMDQLSTKEGARQFILDNISDTEDNEGMRSLMEHPEFDPTTNPFKNKEFDKLVANVFKKTLLDTYMLRGTAVETQMLEVSTSLEVPRIENGKVKFGNVILGSNYKNSVKPGDVVFIARIPLAHPNSLTPLYVKGFAEESQGPIIITHPDVQKLAGADNDRDQRHILSYLKDKKGNVILDDSSAGVKNKILKSLEEDYLNVDNFDDYMDPINKDYIKTIWESKEPLDPYNPWSVLKMHDINNEGQAVKGIGTDYLKFAADAKKNKFTLRTPIRIPLMEFDKNKNFKSVKFQEYSNFDHGKEGNREVDKAHNAYVNLAYDNATDQKLSPLGITANNANTYFGLNSLRVPPEYINNLFKGIPIYNEFLKRAKSNMSASVMPDRNVLTEMAKELVETQYGEKGFNNWWYKRPEKIGEGITDKTIQSALEGNEHDNAEMLKYMKDLMDFGNEIKDIVRTINAHEKGVSSFAEYVRSARLNDALKNSNRIIDVKDFMTGDYTKIGVEMADVYKEHYSKKATSTLLGKSLFKLMEGNFNKTPDRRFNLNEIDKAENIINDYVAQSAIKEEGKGKNYYTEKAQEVLDGLPDDNKLKKYLTINEDGRVSLKAEFYRKKLDTKQAREFATEYENLTTGRKNILTNHSILEYGIGGSTKNGGYNAYLPTTEVVRLGNKVKEIINTWNNPSKAEDIAKELRNHYPELFNKFAEPILTAIKPEFVIHKATGEYKEPNSDIKYMLDGQSEQLASVDPELDKEIRTRLGKLFPTIKVFGDPDTFQKYIERNFPDQKLDLNALGAAIGEAVYIDPKSATQSTAIHEYAHHYWDMLPETDAIKKHLQELTGSEEDAIRLIGTEGVSLAKESMDAGAFKKAIETLKTFWARVKRYVGIASKEDLARIMADRLWNNADKVDMTYSNIRQAKYMTEKDKREKVINNIKSSEEDLEFNEDDHKYTFNKRDDTGKIVENIELASNTEAIGKHELFAFEGEENKDLPNSDIGTGIHKFHEILSKYDDAESASGALRAEFAKRDIEVSDKVLEKLHDQFKNKIAELDGTGTGMVEQKVASTFNGIATTIDRLVIGKNGKGKVYDFKTMQHGADDIEYIKRPTIKIGTESITKESKKVKHGVQLAIISEILRKSDSETGRQGIAIEESAVVPIKYKLEGKKVTSIDIGENVTDFDARVDDYAREILTRTRNEKIGIDHKIIQDFPEQSAKGYADAKAFDLLGKQKRYDELKSKSKENLIGEVKREFYELQSDLNSFKADYAKYQKDRLKIINIAKEWDKNKLADLTPKELRSMHMVLNEYDNLASNAYLLDVIEHINKRHGSAPIEDISKGELIWVGPTSTIKVEKQESFAHTMRETQKAFQGYSEDQVKIKKQIDEVMNNLIKEKKPEMTLKQRIGRKISPALYDYAELFKRMFKEDGSLKHTDDLSVAEKEFVLMQRKLMSDYGVDIAEGYWSKTVPGFFETYHNSGLYDAASNRFSNSINYDFIELKDWKGPDGTIHPDMTFGAAKDLLHKEYNGSNAIGKLSILRQLKTLTGRAKNAYKAKKHETGRTFRQPVANVTYSHTVSGPIKEIHTGGYRVSKEGLLVSKFEDKEAKFTPSHDLYTSTLQELYDRAFVMRMNPYMSDIIATKVLAEKLDKNDFKNLKMYYDLFYKANVTKAGLDSFLPEKVDSTLRFLKAWSYFNVMTFNIPMATMNVVQGKLNAFIDQGGKKFLTGEKRYWTNLRKGQAILRALKVSSVEEEAYGGPEATYFDILGKIGGAAIQLGENYIQGSQVLGMLTKEQWDAYDNKGNIIDFKNQINSEDIRKAKKEKDMVQGFYGQYDKGMYSHLALGQSLMQYRTWMVAFVKSRVGSYHKDIYGTEFKGRYRSVSKIVDILKEGRWNSNDIDAVNNRKNFRGMMVMASLGIMYLALEDKHKKKQNPAAQFAFKALGDIGMMFNLQSMEYLGGNVVPSSKLVVDAIKAADYVSQAIIGSPGAIYKRDSRYGKKGHYKAPGAIYNLMPYKNILKGLGTDVFKTKPKETMYYKVTQ